MTTSARPASNGSQPQACERVDHHQRADGPGRGHDAG
jgi:hypothetical protein